MRPMLVRCLLASLLAVPASALEVTLRLVRAEAPDQLASTAATVIDVSAELAAAAAAAGEGVAAAPGKGGVVGAPPKDAVVAPRAQFDRYVNVMRGNAITIDGAIRFQKTYQGNFLGRTDVLTLDLADGEHVIQPGGHRFTVAGGAVTSDDPSLKARGATLDVVLYPVTVIVVDGSAVRELPAEMRRLPVASRIRLDGEELVPKEEYLAPTATFQRLTLYLMANADGAGYALSPSDRSFHVGPAGVTLVDAAGAPVADGGAWVEDRFTIALSKVAIPVTLRGAGVVASFSGPAGAQRLAVPPGATSSTGTFYAIAAPGGAELTVGVRAQSQPLGLFGDLGAMPRQRVVVDAGDAQAREPRVLAVAMAGFHVAAGAALRARVRSLDALDGPTLSPEQVAAFLWQPAVLQDDGVLRASPSGAVDASEWRQLRIVPAADGLIDVHVPPDVASNVYWVRFVADRRGACSPATALQADMVLGVVNPDAAASLSLFSPSARHAFTHGSELPISVVARGAADIPAGTLRVALRRDGREWTVVEQPVAALGAGTHPFHWRLDGQASAALAPGDYTLVASLGALRSNTWSLRISQRRGANAIPIVAQGMLCQNHLETGVPYVNVPRSIAEANQARTVWRANAAFMGRTYDIWLPEWSFSGPGHATFQGRDSSSEVAQVERILRDVPGLPAHEVYRYAGYFESICDALAHEGMGLMVQAPETWSPMSLIHSVPREVDAKMRQYQLIAQAAERYEHIIGMSPYQYSTQPMGNSEFPDQNRSGRIREMRRQFIAKHGFEPGELSQGGLYLEALMAGRPLTPELADHAKRWEAWAGAVDALAGDYNGLARAAIAPLVPRWKLCGQGPAYGYVGNSSANCDVIEAMMGNADGGWHLTWSSFLIPKTVACTGAEIWASMGAMPNAGPNAFRNLVAGALAGGARGIGYFWGKVPVVSPVGAAQLHLDSEFREVQAMTRRLGPMLRHVAARADIAVLYPHRQLMYEDLKVTHPQWRRYQVELGAWSAMAQLALLGHDSEVLTEEMIDAGELDRFKALIVPGLHRLDDAHLKAIERFAAAGRPVIAGSLTTLLPAGATRIDDDFADILYTNNAWMFQVYGDVEHAWLLPELRRRTAVLATALAGKLTPFASADGTRVLLQTDRAGAGRYTWVWSGTYPSWLGTGRVPVYGNEANERVVMPLREPISFAPGGVVYDVVAGAPVAASARADGRMATTCDLASSPFRLYVTLPTAIAGVRLAAPDAAALGAMVPLTATPVDAGGAAIDASIPLEVTITDADGALVQRLDAASLGSWDGAVMAALGARAGTWTVTVRELLSGHGASATIAVGEGATPFAQALRPVPAVDVQRAALVGEFLAARKNDGDAVLILMDDAQLATRRALADETARALTALGIASEIRSAGDASVYAREERVHLFPAGEKTGAWTEMKPDQYITRHVVLLGGEGDSTLIEEIQEANLLARPLTESYPGPGRGLVALVRSPFAYGRDVLCLLGPDDTGVRAAITALADVSAPAAAPAPIPVAKPAPEPASERATAAISADATPLPPAPVAMASTGAPVQAIAHAADGSRLAFACGAVGDNLFVLDGDGRIQLEDKVGHVDSAALALLPDGRIAVASDGWLYLRATDGSIAWRMPFSSQATERGAIDPRGRWFLSGHATGFAVFDDALKRLWGFDEWEQLASRTDLIAGRAATWVGSLDGGDAIVYRVVGKAPGVAGAYGDELIVADALTGTERRRASLDVRAMAALVGWAPEATPTIETLSMLPGGAGILVRIAWRKDEAHVLLDRDFAPRRGTRFRNPGPLGVQHIDNATLLSDQRLIFTVADRLCVTDAAWTSVDSMICDGLVLSALVDETRGRVVFSSYGGDVTAVDLALKPLWRAGLGTAASLVALDDGRIVAGTVRGDAAMLTADGRVAWTTALPAFMPDDQVERRWAELEALPSANGAAAASPLARIEDQVPLGPDLLRLAGQVGEAPISAAAPGEAFATYLVEWTCRGDGEMVLEASEDEAGAAAPTSRLSLRRRADATDRAERAILRLGDRPESFAVAVRAVSGGAACAVSVRQLLFPSPDIARIPELYRDLAHPAAQADPPAKAAIFGEDLAWGNNAAWSTLIANPFCLLDGRMFAREPQLNGGTWWIGNDTSRSATAHALIPSTIIIELPRKRVISHIVISESVDQPRVGSLCIEAFVEATETRQDLSAFEKRQAARGAWHNLVKTRDDVGTYHLWKLATPVGTRRLAITVLAGHTAIDEIELYEDPANFRRASPKK
ncbi:MAG TPA: hypothetical protein VEL07_05865 [Planctomycetota bacterium]|nr:hypothetical protein [Planctomycetota bacterium]